MRSAFRSLRHSPGFTAVALTVLALGIGAGTAVFSVVDAVVLRGLPFDEHDRLVAVLEQDTRRATTFGSGTITPQTYLDWRRMQEGFDGLAAVSSTTFRLHTENGEPAEARGQRTTSEFFPVLRVAPLIGRTFTADDEIQGRHRVALLSYGFWQRRFGGATDVVGRTLDLNEETWEVVGVLPRDFSYPVGSDKPAEVFVPAMFRDTDRVRKDSRNYGWLAIGRLRAGVSASQASEQMNRVAESLDLQYPKWGPGRRVQIVPLQERFVGRARSWMLMLLGAVILVLLIACANVANLMLARSTVRSREMSIRAALGASRGRLIRDQLVEGLVLALAAAAIGIVLAYGGIQLLRMWLPDNLPRVAWIGMNLRVLAACITAAVATGLAFGIVPAVQATRPDLTNALKDGGRSSTTGTASQRLRSVLIVAEVALAVVLLVGAGLFTGSFVRLMRTDTGIDYHHVLAIDVALRIDFSKQGEFERLREPSRQYVEQMRDAVAHVPGITQVATVSGGLPLTGSWSRGGVTLPDRGELKGDDDSIDIRTVSAGYLELLRIPILRGRSITADDRSTGALVIVVNEAAARKYWPGREALGQQIKVDGKDRVVVGVAGNIRHLGPETPPRQECYIPSAQNDTYGATLVMRTVDDPMTVLPAVKSAIWSVNREQRISGDALTLDGFMDRLIAQRRFNMALLALFGVLGLVIAAVGIYAVMAYLVAQRTNEIGVRMALGATRANVVRLVLSRAAALMAAGLAIGGTASYLMSAGVRSFLFEIEPTNPAIFAAAIGLLTAAGFVASVVPARRAASVDPLVALRHD